MIADHPRQWLTHDREPLTRAPGPELAPRQPGFGETPDPRRLPQYETGAVWDEQGRCWRRPEPGDKPSQRFDFPLDIEWLRWPSQEDFAAWAEYRPFDAV